jgi:hypothetical protein
MNRMDKSQDLVESLIRTAGRRVEPPEDAYRQVFAAANEAFRARTARRRESLWMLWAGAAAVLVLAVALMLQWTPPGAGREELARIERAIGGVERATGDVWQPVGESAAPLTRARMPGSCSRAERRCGSRRRPRSCWTSPAGST